jgi:hypothetical protein
MTNADILETSGKYRVVLALQTESQECNPRTNDECNLANVITFKGQRYIDIDEDGGPLAEGWERIHDRYLDKEAIAVFTRWARIFHGATVVHHRPYDGAEALWYVMPDKLAETTWTAEQVITSEISQYREWAEGNVYGWIVQKNVTRVPKDAEDQEDPEVADETAEWEHVNSCWGYIGREYAEESAREEFEGYKA